jgi:hypothetical protein
MLFTGEDVACWLFLPVPSYKLQVLRIRSKACACLGLCSSVRKLELNRNGS